MQAIGTAFHYYVHAFTRPEVAAWVRVILLVLGLAALPAAGQAQVGPSLGIELLPGDPQPKVQVYWPASATGFVLEETQVLGPAAVWQRVQVEPQVGGAFFVVPLNVQSTSRFYRLQTSGNGDADNDGLLDSLEISLGLDPRKADTDGDGILDGDEDSDGDRLPNRWEYLHGYDPGRSDSDGNGVNDALEDPDGDGLRNLDEARSGADPRSGDTDGDGWDDNGEVLEGTNPANSASEPAVLSVSVTASFLNAAPEATPAGTPIIVATANASYLNAIAETLPSGTVLTASSPLVSHLNAVAEVLPAGTSITASSQVASYLNATPETAFGVIFTVSPVVSYQNQ